MFVCAAAPCNAQVWKRNPVPSDYEQQVALLAAFLQARPRAPLPAAASWMLPGTRAGLYCCWVCTPFFGKEG